jgi:hypothetical protein
MDFPTNDKMTHKLYPYNPNFGLPITCAIYLGWSTLLHVRQNM